MTMQCQILQRRDSGNGAYPALGDHRNGVRGRQHEAPDILVLMGLAEYLAGTVACIRGFHFPEKNIDYFTGHAGARPETAGEFDASEFQPALLEAFAPCHGFCILAGLHDASRNFDQPGATGRVVQRRIDGARTKLLDHYDQVAARIIRQYGRRTTLDDKLPIDQGAPIAIEALVSEPQLLDFQEPVENAFARNDFKPATGHDAGAPQIIRNSIEIGRRHRLDRHRTQQEAWHMISKTDHGLLLAASRWAAGLRRGRT